MKPAEMSAKELINYARSYHQLIPVDVWDQILSRLMNELTISDKNEIATQMIATPEFWCKKKLAISLAAAYHKGILLELLDEWNVPEYVQHRIMDIIIKYWLGRMQEK